MPATWDAGLGLTIAEYHFVESAGEAVQWVRNVLAAALCNQCARLPVAGSILARAGWPGLMPEELKVAEIADGH